MINIKLSQMETDHVCNVLGVAAMELDPILDDVNVIKILSKIDITDDMDMSQVGLDKIKNTLAFIFAISKTYRLGIYKILAEFAQTSPEDIGKRKLMENIDQIIDCLNDEYFLNFFPRLRLLARKELSDISSKPDHAKQT